MWPRFKKKKNVESAQKDFNCMKNWNLHLSALQAIPRTCLKVRANAVKKKGRVFFQGSLTSIVRLVNSVLKTNLSNDQTGHFGISELVDFLGIMAGLLTVE
jgi:hypothetical protein